MRGNNPRTKFPATDSKADLTSGIRDTNGAVFADDFLLVLEFMENASCRDSILGYLISDRFSRAKLS